MPRVRRRKRGGVRLARVFVLLIAVTFGAWFWREVGGTANSASVVVRVVVPKGSTMRAAADSLAKANVIAMPRVFRVYAAVTGDARYIKPGTYQFVAHASYASVLDAMVGGRGIVHTVTIPEGFDIRDITPLLVNALGVSEDSVRAAVTDSAWRRKLNVPAPTLEGYLFPATYAFADGTTAREAVNEMLARFEGEWRTAWNDRLQAMAISRNDAMSMAAIVEKEARKPEERPIIAAVYWNRVKKGMKLQADPTVQFALPAHVERVLYKDLEVNSRYNTYKYAGLPPGPIASPGVASIVAALTPANVPYLYFVAAADGHHEFRTTFAEHERAIAAIKRAKADAAKAAKIAAAKAAAGAKISSAKTTIKGSEPKAKP